MQKTTEGEKTDSLRRKIKRLKEKQKMQKTPEGEKASLSGFPIKDFGNDGGGGFLITDFRHDGERESFRA